MQIVIVVFLWFTSDLLWLKIKLSVIGLERLSKRPSKYSLIHFYKRCVSWDCIKFNTSSPFLTGAKKLHSTPYHSLRTILNVFGHIMLKTPVLVWSLKLSSIEPCEYLDGWPPGNTGCWRHFCYFFVLLIGLSTLVCRPRIGVWVGLMQQHVTSVSKLDQAFKACIHSPKVVFHFLIQESWMPLSVEL